MLHHDFDLQTVSFMSPRVHLGKDHTVCMCNSVSFWAVPGLTDGFDSRKPGGFWFCQPGKRNPGMWAFDENRPLFPSNKQGCTLECYQMPKRWRLAELVFHSLCVLLVRCWIGLCTHLEHIQGNTIATGDVKKDPEQTHSHLQEPFK